MIWVAALFVVFSGSNVKPLLSERVAQRDGKNHPPPSFRRVFVTGAAGFIGSHLSVRLAREPSVETIVGIDNFNDYYSVKLKQYRARRAEDAGAKIVVGDVCDQNTTTVLFARYRFTHVIHLAAQAGVRFSLRNPGAYITANVMCTTALLEVIRKQPRPLPVYVYASSSSVYGHSGSAPFSEDHLIDQPASLYALTKQSTEDLAYLYHHLYGIRSTGLRFFTVYGPWGRPDMAAWIWLGKILAKQPIQLFSTPKGESMRRDFTFVDDIVDGIVLACRHGSPFEIFNLGRGQPVPIRAMVKEIGHLTGTRPKIQNKVMSPADVPYTSCNITHSKEVLGYNPSVTLRDGLRAFVKWYVEYSESTLDLKNLTPWEGTKKIKTYTENDIVY